MTTSELFVGRNGISYDVVIDEDGLSIRVLAAGLLVGTIDLDFRFEEINGYSVFPHYHITHLALEACKGNGIGSFALRLHRDVFETVLTAGVEGPECPDGSHLRGDGVPFIAKMRERGIVAPAAVESILMDEE